MQKSRGFLVLVVVGLIGLTGSAWGQVFDFPLSGAQQETPTGSEATGHCLGYLNQSAATLTVICSHDVQNVTMAHIHRAPAGTSGPPVFPFDDPSSPMKGVFTVDAFDIADLFGGEFYVNVHSTAHPAGEIRGQIGPAADAAVAFPLDGDQAGTGAENSGVCMGALNTLATAFNVACSHNVEDLTMIHIHRGEPGEAGPVVFGFEAATTVIDSVSATDFPGCPDFDGFLADLSEGNLYVNVHNVDAPGGLIRGQIPPPPIVQYFPQFGNGSGFTSSVTITNTSTTSELNGVMYFQDVDGNPLSVGLSTGGIVGTVYGGNAWQLSPVTEVEFNIPALGTVSFVTDGAGDELALGSAKVIADGQFGGIIRFKIPTRGIAGFGSAQAMDRALAPVQVTDSINTAIAIRNNESLPQDIVLILNGPGVTPPGTVGPGVANYASVLIPANGRIALFVDELFPDLDLSEFAGTLTIEASGGSFSAIALELGNEAGEFTSLPVSPLVGP